MLCLLQVERAGCINSSITSHVPFSSKLLHFLPSVVLCGRSPRYGDHQSMYRWLWGMRLFSRYLETHCLFTRKEESQCFFRALTIWLTESALDCWGFSSGSILRICNRGCFFWLSRWSASFSAGVNRTWSHTLFEEKEMKATVRVRWDKNKKLPFTCCGGFCNCFISARRHFTSWRWNVSTLVKCFNPFLPGNVEVD